MRNKIVAILFCLILFAGVVSHVLITDKYYSDNEKRTLKQFPSVSWKNIRSGKFGSDIEEYLADQFPLRNDWVTLKTLSEKASGKKESGGVYFCKDGYLMEIHSSFNEKQTQSNLNAVKNLQDILLEKNVPLYFMPVPTANTILNAELPLFAPNVDQHAIIEEAQQMGIHTVDVGSAFSEHTDEYIFFKTDHHWTSLGSYYAYACWMKEKGVTPDPLSFWKTEVLTNAFRGTTYSKVNYPFAPFDEIEAFYKKEKHEVNYNNGDYITDSIYEKKYLEGTDQYAAFLNSNQATTVVKGEGNGRCLILKDSYANCFAQFCIDDFEETHLIDLRFFRSSVKKYVEEHGITEVLVLYNIPNFTVDTGITICDK